MDQSGDIDVLGKIEAALEQGQLDIADSLARRELASGDARGSLLIAAHLQKGQQWTQLIEVLAPHTEILPENAPMLFCIAQALYETRQYAKCEPYLLEVLKRKPRWAHGRHLMGKLVMHAGRDQEAIPYFREACEIAPGEFKPHLSLALSLSTTGAYKEALEVALRASALKPDNADVQNTIADLRKILEKPEAIKRFNRWPESARAFDDVPSLFQRHIVKDLPTEGFKLRRGMKVFTQGSCFAQNLAKSLQRYDLSVANMTCGEEHNSTFANRAVMDWLQRGVHDAQSSSVAENIGANLRDEYVAYLKDTEMFVYTMGLAAAHFDTNTGEFLMSRGDRASKAALLRRSTFRTTTVQDNVDNLLNIISILRELAPRATIVLTVSPVPMMMTSEFNSAILADCVSKSTLRVAAHEILVKKLSGVIYWPSFEMIRWVGGHTPSVFGTYDGSSHHPNLDMIDHIMDSFIDVFGDEALKATKVVSTR